jgi:hypothetical protein
MNSIPPLSAVEFPAHRSLMVSDSSINHLNGKAGMEQYIFAGCTMSTSASGLKTAPPRNVGHIAVDFFLL